MLDVAAPDIAIGQGNKRRRASAGRALGGREIAFGGGTVPREARRGRRGPGTARARAARASRPLRPAGQTLGGTGLRSRIASAISIMPSDDFGVGVAGPGRNGPRCGSRSGPGLDRGIAHRRATRPAAAASRTPMAAAQRSSSLCPDRIQPSASCGCRHFRQSESCGIIRISVRLTLSFAALLSHSHSRSDGRNGHNHSRRRFRATWSALRRARGSRSLRAG